MDGRTESSVCIGGLAMYTVREIAGMYGVTPMAVRLWIKAGCPHAVERVIGVKDRTILNKECVDKWLTTTKKRNV